MVTISAELSRRIGRIADYLIEFGLSYGELYNLATVAESAKSFNELPHKDLIIEAEKMKMKNKY